MWVVWQKSENFLKHIPWKGWPTKQFNFSEKEKPETQKRCQSFAPLDELYSLTWITMPTKHVVSWELFHVTTQFGVNKINHWGDHSHESLMFAFLQIPWFWAWHILHIVSWSARFFLSGWFFTWGTILWLRVELTKCVFKQEAWDSVTFWQV